MTGMMQLTTGQAPGRLQELAALHPVQMTAPARMIAKTQRHFHNAHPHHHSIQLLCCHVYLKTCTLQATIKALDSNLDTKCLDLYTKPFKDCTAS